MKAYGGDIPKDHLNLIKDLRRLENWFYNNRETMSVEDFAKGFVCISHDYHMMYMEEEGDRFLLLVEEHCPGYFKEGIFVEADKDGDFGQLVSQLKETLAIDTMIKLGFPDE